MGVEVKKGLRNPLDEAQVRKAVLALQAFVDKQKAERAKQPLVENADSLSCIITRKLVPGKASLKPISIDIPHSLYGDESGAEVCLFVKDDDKQRVKEALAKDPVPCLTKVMTVKKLRKNFSRFEDRRTLAGAYDLFLADDRVLPYLKAPLGTKFFEKKKQPISVRISRKDVSFAIRAVFHRTALHVSSGACNNVKVARLDMTVDEIVENVMVAMNNCASHIPKGWNGIQSISIKTNESIALPVFNSLAQLSKLPPVSKAQALTKRKLEEVEAAKKAEEEEPVAEEPAKKKAKKGKKAAEPVKEAVKAASPAKAKKEKKAKKVEEVKTEKKEKEKKADDKVKKEKKDKSSAKPIKKEVEEKAKPSKKDKSPAKPSKKKDSAPADEDKASKKKRKQEKEQPAKAADDETPSKKKKKKHSKN